LRKAVTEQSQAIYQGTVANYRQTVLTAFQEVEDNLSTLRILSQELQQQNAAVASSQRYLTLANVRYQSGIEIYLNVIAAQTTLLNNQRSALNLQMQPLTTSVQLIKSLGGEGSECLNSFLRHALKTSFGRSGNSSPTTIPLPRRAWSKPRTKLLKILP
jgi:outer membrane protein TolC